MKALRFASIALVVFTASGCGTIFNLADSPVGPDHFGTGHCYPFGGATRSSAGAVMATTGGVVEISEASKAFTQGDFEKGVSQTGVGTYLTAVGVGAFADLPMSFVGDIVTWPVAYARSKEYPWATWWGAKSRIDPLGQERARYHGGVDTNIATRHSGVGDEPDSSAPSP